MAQPVQKTKKESVGTDGSSQDLSLSDKPNLKKSLINSKNKSIEMTNIKTKSGKDKDAKQKDNKDKFNKAYRGTLIEEEEEEEEIQIERMVRFKLYKWE